MNEMVKVELSAHFRTSFSDPLNVDFTSPSEASDRLDR